MKPAIHSDHSDYICLACDKVFHDLKPTVHTEQILRGNGDDTQFEASICCPDCGSDLDMVAAVECDGCGKWCDWTEIDNDSLCQMCAKSNLF